MANLERDVRSTFSQFSTLRTSPVVFPPAHTLSIWLNYIQMEVIVEYHTKHNISFEHVQSNLEHSRADRAI
jgi:hypothetical protein